MIQVDKLMFITFWNVEGTDFVGVNGAFIGQFHHTGSTAICDPPPRDTDTDFVVLPRIGYSTSLVNELLAAGFRIEGDADGYDDNVFTSLRRGSLNIIVVTGSNFYKKWEKATGKAKTLNLCDKQTRVEFFRNALYND